MPHYNIWIREDDDNKWKAIENRGQWLHDKLVEGTRGVVKQKAAPGTVDPMTGLEIDEFHFSSPKVRALTDKLEEPKASTQDVLTEITELELARDDKLEYCQDETEAKRINKEYKQRIDACWKRYDKLKAAKV